MFTNGNFLSQLSISATAGDAPIVITVNLNLPDTVSLACGVKDGLTECGTRVISF